MVVLAFAVGGSANLPVLIFALYWKHFNTEGAIAGMLARLLSSVLLVIIGPSVLGENAFFSLANPGIISIPLGFITMIVVSLITKPEYNTAKYNEMDVKSNTRLGAEL